MDESEKKMNYLNENIVNQGYNKDDFIKYMSLQKRHLNSKWRID